jgi:hypothetical protein
MRCPQEVLPGTREALQQGTRQQQPEAFEMGRLGVKAAIGKIIVTERIRKDITKISELAEDIGKNGLINPVTVMSLDDGEFRLLAGLRRIKAVQSLGETEIEVNVVSPADAEAALNIEYSENEQRENFTYSERMDYAGLIKEIEKAKGKERMSIGGKGGISEGMDGRPYLESGTSRDAIGAKINMSGRQYDRAEYVAKKAPPEIIEQIDNGERTVYNAFQELKAKEKAKSPAPDDGPDESDDAIEETSPPKPKPKPDPTAPKRSRPVPEEEQMKYLSEADKEGIRKLREFEALPPEGKIGELERQLKEMCVRAVTAESDLATLKLNSGISIDHKDSIIESLKRQNAELTEALEAAHMRIAELEAQNSVNGTSA